MTRRFLPLAAFLLTSIVLGSCGGNDVGLTPAQQVYEVVIYERIQDPTREVIVLRDTESQALVGRTINDLAFHIGVAGDPPAQLIERLIVAAGQSKPLNWHPVLINAKFVSKADISNHPSWSSREFSESFLAKYPDHSEFYALSDVAVAENGREAVLLVSYFCPAMCGSGEFLVYLQKSGLEWNIVGSSVFWTT